MPVIVIAFVAGFVLVDNSYQGRDHGALFDWLRW